MKMREILLYFSFKYEGDFDKVCSAIAKKEPVDEQKLKEYVESLNYDYITLLDDDYPSFFKCLAKPPFVIYLVGNKRYLNDNLKVAIIGSRKNTLYGKKACEYVTKELVAENVTIISGMAKGIDGISQQETINNNGKTIGIIGSGFDKFYPKENLPLYNTLKEKGLVISEYPPFVNASKDKFLRRNSLIAALANKIVVIEAYKRSGTLNTVMNGLELGKDIYCVPCLLFKDSICNKLIKEGASIVTCASDILQ